MIVVYNTSKGPRCSGEGVMEIVGKVFVKVKYKDIVFEHKKWYASCNVQIGDGWGSEYILPHLTWHIGVDIKKVAMGKGSIYVNSH